jgi:hypothetical protein
LPCCSFAVPVVADATVVLSEAQRSRRTRDKPDPLNNPALSTQQVLPWFSLSLPTGRAFADKLNHPKSLQPKTNHSNTLQKTSPEQRAHGKHNPTSPKRPRAPSIAASRDGWDANISTFAVPSLQQSQGLQRGHFASKSLQPKPSRSKTLQKNITVAKRDPFDATNSRHKHLWHPCNILA